MKLRTALLALVASVVTVPLTAKAGIIVNGSGSSAFQSVGSMSESGPAYWASGSSDGSQANIGYFLNKSGYYASNYGGTSPAIAVSDIQYWGTASGAADPGVSFTATGAVHVELLLTLAGDYAVNQFGWYKASDPNSKVALFQNGYDAGDGIQSLAFGNNGSYGTTPLAATFNPGGDFGFYLTNGLGQTFYTQSGLNSEGTSQLFAFLRSLGDPSNSVLYLGNEDRLNGDFDYNDVVIRVSSTAVPEPSSLALVGIGGGFLLAARIRRRRAK